MHVYVLKVFHLNILLGMTPLLALVVMVVLSLP